MDWEPATTRDSLGVPRNDKMRSLSTSTPFLPAQSSTKLFRSHSVSVCSADSGLGDSLNVSDADVIFSPDYMNTSGATTIASSEYMNTPSVCHTPRVTLFDSTIQGRHLEFSAISPVLRHKNIQRETSIDSDIYSFDNDETLSEASMPYLSKLNLDGDSEFTCSTDNMPCVGIPKLNLNLLEDSPMDLPMPKVTTQPDSALSPEFYAILQQFMPEVRDRVIGRNIGIDHVDILAELQERGMNRIIGNILAYLDPQDICRYM